MEKLIERAIDNVANAVIAYDKSYEELFGNSHEIPDDLRAMTSAAELSSVRRFIDQNKTILAEINLLVNTRNIQLPRLLRGTLKIVQEKNNEAVISLLAHDIVRGKEKPDDSAVLHITHEIILREDTRADLMKVVNSLNDFKNLLQKYFSISSLEYVPENRLDGLRAVESDDFDLSKLIRFCEELNSAFQNENYLSVAILARAILDHVPPIFGFKTFIEVVNNYGGKSFKKSSQNLQNSSRNIADAYLHEPIRRKESLPNGIQIDFRNDLDVLLGEIVRILT